jgi:hypothetical protein
MLQQERKKEKERYDNAYYKEKGAEVGACDLRWSDKSD